jgi:NDP-sugar pyrophosphorylase family protein
MHAILLVGGKGTRLMPHTEYLPKPLVKLGDYTILEIILRRLHAYGFDRITLCISHMGDAIKAEIGNGRQLGLSVDYCTDTRPLGTAAPLRLVTDWHSPAVVMNGDILTTADFGDLYRHHQDNGGAMTIAVHRRWLVSGVGLVQLLGDKVTAIREKPEFEWNVSAGIYVVDPRVKRYIPEDTPVDMPTLINILIRDGERVGGHRFTESWFDIGTPARYEEAKARFLANPGLFLDPHVPGEVADAEIADFESWLRVVPDSAAPEVDLALPHPQLTDGLAVETLI